MAKDPAFLFYSQDFIVGTLTMNFEDKGKYITILSLMHQQGRMTEETIRLLVGSISDNLKSKFKIDDDGLWYNIKLESETEKRNKFTESRRNNGSLGGRPKKEDEPNDKPKNNLPDNHTGNLMGNENEDVIVNKEEKKKVFPFKSELLKHGANEDLIDDWLKVRIKKSATNSKTAFNLFISQVEKSNRTINEVLTKCIEKDWKGFDATWEWTETKSKGVYNPDLPAPQPSGGLVQ